tara:strand:+ start:86 stop:757 length:672 start_codon:yes stop_codon:yes gene_type:complete
MSVLEQITQMKSQGVSENEIVKQLQEQGISPKEINDVFDQAQIKKAVSSENPKTEELHAPSQKTYTPKTQEISGQEMYSPQPQTQQEEQYQGYPQEEAYDYSQTGVDTNTIIEVSEQVFFEKIQKIQKKVDEIYEFKTLGESKIENLSERIKKIETIIDKMQIAILEKIGSYGSNLEGIKKEMSMMQDSFGKIVNSVSEKQTNKTSAKKDKTFSKLKKISRKK